MKKIITIIFCTVMALSVQAQQQAMFTQYMFNGLVINPAYAGSQEQASASLLVREQWVGLEGAPSTKTLSAHSPVLNKNIGLGVLFINDKIGVTEQNGLYTSYAYRLKLNRRAKLSMGMQVGFSSYSVGLSNANTDDPTFNTGDIRELHPNIGAGIYYHNDKFFAGLSVPHLIENVFDQTNDDSNSKLVRHYFFTSGFVTDLSHGLKLNPSVLLKYVENTPLGLDLNVNLIIHDLLWLGTSVRNFNSFDALIQLQITERMRLGYAYDFANTSALGSVNSGSHEILLSYAFHTNHKLVTTPRFF